MAVKRQWFPLDLNALPNCRIIACDPSFSAMGIVFLEVYDGQVTVNGAEKLATEPTAEGGWESNFARAEELYGRISYIFSEWLEDWGAGTIAVHESPPSGGGNLMRIESSILGGREFRRAATQWSVPIGKLVTPQSHKKLLCGNHIAKKPEHHAAIKLLLPDILDSKVITNEALRDALSIALYAAHRQQTNTYAT